MTQKAKGLPAGWRLDFDDAPSAETRAAIGREINAFHARTVPHQSRRFAFLVHDDQQRLAAGVVGVISWQWLFIEALWVGDTLRGVGLGRTLMAQAEAHALSAGCQSAWLDTFQAQDFYLAIGYQPFGVLDDYPPGQSRHFMKRRLGPPTA
jgi:GNAT superfamily N-acetyltransferase